MVVLLGDWRFPSHGQTDDGMTVASDSQFEKGDRPVTKRDAGLPTASPFPLLCWLLR